jgi:hypothetical protein
VKTPLLGASYVARSVNAADNRMVNLFPEVVPEGGKEKGWLQRAPGLSLRARAGTGPVRGLWSYGGFSYAVSGAVLYRITAAGVVTVLGDVPGTGPVSMADNGTQMFVAAGGPSFIYNATTGVLEPITDPDFPGAAQVDYLDGYFVFIEPNSQRVWVTELLDGTSVDPLDFASAEGNPDGLVGLIVDHREVWLFGSQSVEVWVNSGNVDFPLERLNGAFNEVGCAATFSVAKLDNGVFWLGADDRGRGIVYRANGYTAVRISTHAVEWQIQSYGDISDAIAYSYQQDGHTFYVLTFPTADRTWVYDVATNAWHERASFDNGVLRRHRSNCQTAFNSEVWVGDFEDGRVYALDLDTYADDDQPQKWLRSWRALPPGANTLRRTAQHELQLDCEAGVGLNGIDTMAVLVDIELLTELDDDILTEDSGTQAPSGTQSSMQDHSAAAIRIVCASNGAFIVAVTFIGPTPVRATSSDGLNWSAWAPILDVGTPTNCNVVAFQNNQFVTAAYTAGTPDTYIQTSPDGANWTLRATKTIGAALVDLVYGNGVWVGVRTGSNYEISTDNLATLTQQTLPGGFVATRVCYTGTHFIVTDTAGRAAFSTTGLTGSWTIGAYALGTPSSDWIGVAHGNGVTVIRRNGFNYGAASTDNGATWTLVTMPVQSVERMTFAAAKFAMAGPGTTNACIYSADGVTWASISVPVSRPYQGIAPFGNFAVSVAGAASIPNFSALWNLGFDNPDTPLLIDTALTQGVIPKVMLRWSDDGGHTWSNEHWREIGRMGEYGTRVIWRRLGMTEKLRDRVYEVSGTDPIKIALMGADLEASATRD